MMAHEYPTCLALCGLLKYKAVEAMSQTQMVSGFLANLAGQKDAHDVVRTHVCGAMTPRGTSPPRGGSPSRRSTPGSGFGARDARVGTSGTPGSAAAPARSPPRSPAGTPTAASGAPNAGTAAAAAASAGREPSDVAKSRFAPRAKAPPALPAASATDEMHGEDFVRPPAARPTLQGRGRGGPVAMLGRPAEAAGASAPAPGPPAPRAASPRSARGFMGHAGVSRPGLALLAARRALLTQWTIAAFRGSVQR